MCTFNGTLYDIYSEKEGNETEGQIISKKYFYGPATNCKELSILGYTLNGFYLVKGKGSSKNTKVEIISCQFKQVSGLKEGKYPHTKT